MSSINPPPPPVPPTGQPLPPPPPPGLPGSPIPSLPQPSAGDRRSSGSPRRKRVLIGLAGLLVLLGGAFAAWSLTGDDDGAEPAAAVEDVSGMIFGSVEDVEGNGVDAVDIVVTAAGDALPGAGGDPDAPTTTPDGSTTETDPGAAGELGRSVSDELGLFEVDLGRHDGPVIVTATRQGEHAATIVAVSPDSTTTGIRLVVGAPGPGTVEGLVSAAEGGTLDESGLVEARFVETGRTDVIALGPDARFRFDALPLDGDLILVATTTSGAHQGLTATVVSESLSTNTADITLRAPAEQGSGAQVSDPDIVTDGLEDWVLDGPVTVIPVDELG